jgi:hypothetical protein
MKEKGSAARWSRGLRFVSVLLAVAGGIVPLVHAARPSIVNAEWGFVLLGLAGGALALDRLFGWSSSYSRYMSAAFAVQHALASFEASWVLEMSRLGGSPPSVSQLEGLLRVISDFGDVVITLVEDETASWATDLTTQLARLEKAASTRPHA